MFEPRILQGRRITQQDIGTIRALLQEYPEVHRRRLSQLLCAAWNWKNERGQDKDMAARSLMLKLHELGEIKLPAARRAPTNAQRGRRLPPAPMAGPALSAPLSALEPISLEPMFAGHAERQLFLGLLAHYHYLGYRGPAGENLEYLVWSHIGQPLGCLVFDAAAWKVAARDQYVGWSGEVRQARLRWVTNNSRFLILPWIGVPHLASHVLALATGRLRADWQSKYGHAVELVETFVQQDRFRGTCYRAANWIFLGVTRGRSRNDTNGTLQVPLKDIYVYPLNRSFRQRLGATDA